MINNKFYTLKGNTFHVAVFKDHDNRPGLRKFAKRQASKQVRRYRHFIPNGGSYKALFDSYDIYDYKSDGRFGFDRWPEVPYHITRGGQNYVSR